MQKQLDPQNVANKTILLDIADVELEMQFLRLLSWPLLGRWWYKTRPFACKSLRFSGLLLLLATNLVPQF